MWGKAPDTLGLCIDCKYLNEIEQNILHLVCWNTTPNWLKAYSEYFVEGNIKQRLLALAKEPHMNLESEE